MSESLYVECSCMSEVVIFRAEEWSPGISEMCISMFERNGARSLWNRTRQAWHVLRTGRPYADQMSLNKEEAARLAKFLTDWADHPVAQSETTAGQNRAGGPWVEPPNRKRAG